MRRFSPTIQEQLHETPIQQKVQELWRDCKILARKISLGKNQYDIYEYYNLLRYNKIPNFIQWRNKNDNSSKKETH